MTTAGRSNTQRNTIPNTKVQSFMTLFDKLCDGLGGLTAACKFAGVNRATISAIEDGRPMTAQTAERIFTAYKKWKEGA